MGMSAFLYAKRKAMKYNSDVVLTGRFKINLHILIGRYIEIYENFGTF